MMNNVLKAKIILYYGTECDFAETIGKSSPFVSRVVRGRFKLPDIDKKLWAEKLNCSINDIFVN